MAIRLSLHPMKPLFVQALIAGPHTKPPVSPNRQAVQPQGGIYGS